MTARHAAPRRRSASRPLAVGALVTTALLVGGHGVWAVVNATASGGAQSVSSGTLVLQNGTSSLSAAISGIGPGDTVNRHLVLNNTGSLAAAGITLGLATSTPSSTLITDTATTSGLRITVNSCTIAWTTSSGTCSGTSAVALSQRPLGSLVGSPAALTLPAAATTAGGSAYLQVSLFLPTQTETSTNGVGPATSIQAATAGVTYTFTAAQRSATTTTS